MIQINTLKGFEKVVEYYYCDNEGNIWSKVYGDLRQLKGSSDNLGYKRVSLKHKDGKFKLCLVHRIICTAYHENPDNKPTVNHINHNPSDNRAENLEWSTQSEQANNHWKARQVKQGKKVILKDHENCRVMVFQSQSQCARYLKVNVGSVSSAIKNEHKCKGYVLKFI